MKQINTKSLFGNAGKTAFFVPATNFAKGKKIIVDIIGPKKGKK